MLFPEGNKVIVRPDTVEEITAGGIVIPDSVQDSRQTAATRGEIVALGPEADVSFSEDMDGITKRNAKPGDRCVFAKYGGSSIKFKGPGGKWQEHRVLIDENIICFIDDDEKEEPVSRISMVK